MKINPNAPPTTPPGSTGVPPGQAKKDGTDFESVLQETDEDRELESQDQKPRERKLPPGQVRQAEKQAVASQGRRESIPYTSQEIPLPKEEVAQPPAQEVEAEEQSVQEVTTVPDQDVQEAGEESKMIKEQLPPEKIAVATDTGVDPSQKAKQPKDFSNALKQQPDQASQTGQSDAAKAAPRAEGQQELSEEDVKLKGSGEAESKSHKTTKNILRDQEVKREPLGSQALPVSAYLEPPAPPKELDASGQPALQIAEIEKIVDNVFVGVNASGDPEFKLDMNLRELGNLQVKVTRTPEGLVIHFNTETEKAGLQLGQNLQALQTTLAQKGLQLNNLQLTIQNQPVPMNEFVQAARSAPDSRWSRREPQSKTERARKDKPAPPPKGR